VDVPQGLATGTDTSELQADVAHAVDLDMRRGRVQRRRTIGNARR
jgi:hypothetical protein